MTRPELKHCPGPAPTGAAKRNGDAPLPCRGCTRKCSHYGHCQGKPWRAGTC